MGLGMHDSAPDSRDNNFPKRIRKFGSVKRIRPFGRFENPQGSNSQINIEDLKICYFFSRL